MRSIPKDVAQAAGVSESASLAALIQSAKQIWIQGDAEKARRIVRWVHDAIPGADFDAHLDLYYAYVLGVGSFETTERLQRTFEILKQAALMSEHPQLLWTVAQHYRNGLNEVPKDLTQARTWTDRAAQAGNEEALTFLNAAQTISRNPEH